MRVLVFALCAVTLCMQRTHCKLIAKMDQRIDGDCTFLLKEVNTASECACFLKDNAESVEAVSFDFSTKRCLSATHDSDYAIVTASKWITFTIDSEANQTTEEQSTGKQHFTVSADWTVPRGVNSFTGLCIGGGGGGGSSGAFGGGGSGWIAYGTVSTEPGTLVRVVVGNIGYSASNGGNSSIGHWIIARGGIGGASDAVGGRGGSGGGGGSTQYGMTGGNGSSGGGDGFPATNGPGGGFGQGTEAWLAAVAALSQFKILFGSGGRAGIGSSSAYAGAGGGGGGIIVDNFNVAASVGASGGAGYGGAGYGAGGGGAGCYNNNCYSYNGGSGAPGICIIQW